MEAEISKAIKPEIRINQSEKHDLSVDTTVFYINSYHVESRDTDKIEWGVIFIRMKSEFFNGMRLKIRINRVNQRILSVPPADFAPTHPIFSEIPLLLSYN